jgi:hypothetical protein
MLIDFVILKPTCVCESTMIQRRHDNCDLSCFLRRGTLLHPWRRAGDEVLPKINLRIITNIQAAAESFYTGIAANQ